MDETHIPIYPHFPPICDACGERYEPESPLMLEKLGNLERVKVFIDIGTTLPDEEGVHFPAVIYLKPVCPSCIRQALKAYLLAAEG